VPCSFDALMPWAQSRNQPSGDVFRARLIVALAQGLSYREIEETLNTSAPILARYWG
jgi:hypothetical protein